MAEAFSQNWLLLRGLGRQSAHWGSFVPQLQTAFPQSVLHALDLPGFGEFSHLPSPENMSQIVDFLRQQALARHMLNQPLCLLGLSLGGMVAWQWMQQYPQDVAAAVIINSSMADLSPFYQRLRWQNLGAIGRILCSRDRQVREQGIVNLVSNLDQIKRMQTAAAWVDIDVKQPMRLDRLVNQLRAAAGYRPGTQAPNQPVLVLNSQGDRLVAPDCSLRIQQRFGLPLMSHPTAGHDLPLDDGVWLISCLKAWAAQNGLT